MLGRVTWGWAALAGFSQTSGKRGGRLVAREVPEVALCLGWAGKQPDSAPLPLVLQKADGTCNTNFKKTQAVEQVTKVLEDFVDRDHGILVSGMPMCQSILALAGFGDPGQL